MKKINKILLGLATLAVIGTFLPTDAYAEVEVGLATGQYNKNTETSKSKFQTSKAEDTTKTTNNFTPFDTDYVVKALGTDNTITGVNVTFIPVDYYGRYLGTSVEIHDVPIVGNNTIKFEQLYMLGIGVNWKPGAIAGYQGDIVITDPTIYPGQHIEVKMRYYERIEAPSKLYSQAEGKSKNWENVDEKWYYIDESRNIFSGWKKIDGNWYYFNPYKGLEAYSNISPIYDGQMVTDTTIDGYYLNADGVCIN